MTDFDETRPHEGPPRPGRQLLVSFLVALIVVVAIHSLDFKGSVPDFRRKARGGELLDIRPSFSVDEIYSRLEAYGEEGRQVYSFRNLTVDIALPLGVLVFLIPFALASLARLPPARWSRVALLSFPIAYLAFDLAENFTVVTLLSRYPERVQPLALVLPYFTVIKRTASVLSLFAPMVLFAVAWSRSRFREETQEPAEP